MIIGLTHVLVVFRVIAAVLLAEGSWEFLSTHSNSGAMMLGAIFHYFIITVMTRVHKSLNVCLCCLLLIIFVSMTMSLSLQVNRVVAMKLCEIGILSHCIFYHLTTLCTTFQMLSHLCFWADLNIIFYIQFMFLFWNLISLRIR